MKLGVDVGNYNINTSENIMFKAAVSTFKDFGSTADKIVIDNKAYYLGDGYLEIDYRKFDKSNYLPLLLGAICKSTTHEEIELGLGLPLTQYKGFKIELINMLNKKEFNVVFNNKNRNIKITKVDVFPEGVASLIASFDKLKDKIGNRDVIVVDMGGKTTDIALLHNKRVIKSTSINKGTIDVYNEIKLALEDKYFDVKIDIDKVQDYIDKGFFYKGEKQNIRFAIKRSNDIFKEIYNELKLNYPINSEAVVLQGGGSSLLGDVFKEKIQGLFIDDDLFANAKGYKMLLK